MAQALPEYSSFLPKDSPEDATMWCDCLEGFQAMVTDMQVEDDAAAADGQAAKTKKEVQEIVKTMV